MLVGAEKLIKELHAAAVQFVPGEVMSRGLVGTKETVESTTVIDLLLTPELLIARIETSYEDDC